MAKSIFWCKHCYVPIIKSHKCSLCGNDCELISSSGICNPVFYNERKLLSYILGYDVVDKIVWYLGSSNYLIDGNRVHIPYVDFYTKKKHLDISKELREGDKDNDIIPNISAYLAVNRRYLEDIIFEAEDYIINSTNEFTNNSDDVYIPTVSYSGGKDSTVISRLVKDALQNENIIHFFGDTTLEFPCTYSHISNDYRKENPFTPLINSETDSDFFKLCNVFGPPSKSIRWCCTIFKTSTLNTELQHIPGKSLTFLGIRRSESRERFNYQRTQTESKIGSQVNAMPIIDWNDCDVWAYILHKNLCYNKAYRWGYKRVGCWCCPNNSNWSSMLTDIYYPALSEKWKNVLYAFAEKTKKTDIEDYVENGKWKIRRDSTGLESRNVVINDTPCNLGNKARNLIIRKPLNKNVIEFFKPFGELSVLDKDDATYITITEREVINEHEIIYPKRKAFELVITWGTTVVKVLPAGGTDAQVLISRLKCQLRKYQFCLRCSACDSLCPKNAISTVGNDTYVVNESYCEQNPNVCAKCIAKFYNGCITCKVLAGKKDTNLGDADSID